MSAALLCSGNNYEKVRLMHSFLRLGITASTTHYQFQSKHAIPVIKQEFERMMAANMEKYIGKHIVIAGEIYTIYLHIHTVKVLNDIIF